MNKRTKEVCDHCSKSINLGQLIYECSNCNKILHKKCFKNSKSVTIHENFYCLTCSKNLDNHYNPFVDMDHDGHNDDCNDPDLTRISTILESCKAHTVKEINNTHSDIISKNKSLFFLNIDGNKSNFDTLAAELSRYTHKHSIIGLAETNTDQELGSLYQLTDYNQFYQSTIPGKSTGTGVALYVHNTLNANIYDSVSQITPNLETLFIKLSSKTIGNNNQTIVGVVYRPPNGDFDLSMNELSSILEKLPKSCVHIMGDFNVNLLDQTLCKLSKFEDVIYRYGFYPLISRATHVKSGCKPSCIDNILTNSIDQVVETAIVSDNINHHMPVLSIIDINVESTEIKNKFVKHYDFCSSNVDLFTKVLEQRLSEQSTQDFSSFNYIFHEVLDKTCKLEKPKISKRTVLNNPWVTGGIVAAIEKKHYLHKVKIKAAKVKCLIKLKGNDRKFCHCTTCIYKRKTHVKFCDYRRVLKKLVEDSKDKYYGRKFDENSGNSRKIWEIINSIRGKQKRQIKPLFVINDEKITDRRRIANEFNKYFASIASELNKKYSGSNDTKDHGNNGNSMPSRLQNSIFLTETDQTEILKTITEFENGKSSDIPVHVIKRSAHVFSKTLAQIYNNCMKHGEFPADLKLGRVTPIYKKDCEQTLGNYRPVSTLPIFGKLFEKLIHKRLYSFLSSNGILYENQFGFRKNHSTTHALNYSVDYVKKAVGLKQHVLGLFIDLSKAFDTISHNKLLEKLENYGIRGNALDLIRSYLSDRYQFTSVLDETSEKLLTEFGIPQGSVLGPLLFIIYINDIYRATPLGKFVLFADDTNIFIVARTKSEVYADANKVLAAINSYMKSNLLHINLKKCCFMHFEPPTRKKRYDGNESDDTDLTLSLNGVTINKVSEVKFLGVTIDDKLTWKPHIRKLLTKLKRECGRIYSIKRNIPKHLHNMLYHTLFESHLSYGISVWGMVSRTALEPILSVQKKCVRMIFGDNEAYADKFRTCARVREFGSQTLGSEFYRQEEVEPLFVKEKILSLHSLYKYFTVLEMYKIIKLRDPYSMYSLFCKSRRRDDLLITSTPAPLFTYHSAHLWNTCRKTSSRIDFTEPISGIKRTLRQSLLELQKEFGLVHDKFSF